jgi:hypothetical protein
VARNDWRDDATDGGSAISKKRSSGVTADIQRAHAFALQSLAKEIELNLAAEQEVAEKPSGKHLRVQDRLVRKAFDEIHSRLAAFD